MKKLFVFSLFIHRLLIADQDLLLGQKAHYDLDKNPSRTSSMIISGAIDTIVNRFIDGDDPAYEVLIDYAFDISLFGFHKGSEPVMVEPFYFSPLFLEGLRKTGKYTGPNFSATHKGYKDVKNLDERVYPNCDVVFIYDIKQKSLIHKIAQNILGANAGEIENLTATVHIYPGVPVLGGVKIDVSGKYKGISFKAGGDYTP